MEVSREPPSWLSIITKAKRFSIDVQIDQFNNFNNLTLPPEPDPVPVPLNNGGGSGSGSSPTTAQSMPNSKSLSVNNSATSVIRKLSPRLPKSNGHRTFTPQDKNSEEIRIVDSHPGFGVALQTATKTGSSSGSSFSSGTSSTLSSPSPRPLSSGSGSSAEEDLTISSFLRTSMNKNGPRLALPLTSMQIEIDPLKIFPNLVPHSTPGVPDFQILQELNNWRKKPKFTPISVIKTTDSFLRNEDFEDEQPQDLSIKSQNPKRLPTTSSRSSIEGGDEIPRETKTRNDDFSDEGTDECVQDLSLRVRSISEHLGPTNHSDSTNSKKSDGKIDVSSFFANVASINNKEQDLDDDKDQNQVNKRQKGRKYSSSNVDDGDLVIVEESSNQNKTFSVEVALPGQVKEEEKPIGVKSDDVASTKDNHAETEVEVKSRRGRKRKDEETVVKQYDCFLCPFTSVREPVLKNHMMRMHTVKGNRGSVKCTVCAYASPTLEELRSHQELIHGQGAKDAEGNPSEPITKVAFHACSHCTKKFRSQSQLDAHLRLIAQKQLWKDLKTRRMT